MKSALAQARWRNVGACLLLIWAGLTIGVAFIATPAKFLATMLTWSSWLDVGRHTFGIYNKVELALVIAAVFIALLSRQQVLLRAIVIPALVVLAETLWLIPALDHGVVTFIEGKQAHPKLPLHYVYIVSEALKTVALMFFGWRCLSAAPAGASR